MYLDFIKKTAFILFITYYQVQVAVAVNNWYRPFYDAIQNALSDESTTTASDLYGYMFSFLILALTYVLIAVFTSFFENTSNYYQIIKDTFLFEYIFNSLVLLISVLVLTFLIGTSTAYLVSFYKFPGSDFFKWALILSLIHI